MPDFLSRPALFAVILLALTAALVACEIPTEPTTTPITIIASRVAGEASRPTPTPITISASRSTATAESSETVSTPENTATPVPAVTPTRTDTAAPASTPLPARGTAVPTPTTTPVPTATPTAIHTATPTPTGTPHPTATPTAIPTATPTPAPILNLVKAGFGQFGNEVSFAFIVENPSMELAVQDSEYRALYFDADGILLESDTGSIASLLPGDREAVASNHSSFFRAGRVPSGTIVDRVEIRLQPGIGEVLNITHPTINFGLVEDESFRVVPPGAFESVGTAVVSGAIRNPYPRDYDDAELVVVFYDTDGNIVGGDVKSPFNFIPAESRVAFEMTWGWLDDFAGHFTTAPVSAEVYLARFVPLKPTVTPTQTSELNLIKAGFGQSGNEVSFAFIVENPSMELSLQDSEYRALYFDADGILLQSDAGSIASLLPGDREAVASNHSSFFRAGRVPSGTIVDRVEIRLQPGIGEVLNITHPTINFGLVEDESFRVVPPGAFESVGTAVVSGAIRNPYPRDYDDAELVVVFYDTDGNIVGGDVKSPFDFIPAESRVAFEMTWGWLDDFAEHFTTAPVSAEVYLTGFQATR